MACGRRKHAACLPDQDRNRYRQALQDAAASPGAAHTDVRMNNHVCAVPAGTGPKEPDNRFDPICFLFVRMWVRMRVRALAVRCLLVARVLMSVSRW